MFKDFLLRVKALILRRRFDQDLEDEVAFHLAMREEKSRAAGSDEGEARQAAWRQFGNPARAREEMRVMRSFALMETLGQDLRYGARLLRKSPMFTLVAGATLALGIGANTAIFSVVYAVLLRLLPYVHPEQLVVAFETNEHRGVKLGGCSYPDLTELLRSGTFSSVAGVQRHDLTLTGYGSPTVVRTVAVTPEIFPLLSVSPLAGRYLFSEDETKGAAPVVLVSEGLWRTRFGEKPNLLGGSITLDQKAFTVVGIMPAGFQVPVFGSRQEVWIPMMQDPLFSGWIPKREQHWLPVVGRLNSGVSIARAQSEVNAVSSRLASEFPVENGGWAVRLAPLQQAIVADLRTPLLVLFGAVGLVLLIVCVNIANLLLARATSRTREVALRQALGAQRSRIIRQLLTESMVLGLLGAILGAMLAYWGAHALGSFLPADTPAVHNVQLNGSVLGFAVLLSLAASIGFGLAPALLTAGSDVQSNLKEGVAGSGVGRGWVRARGFLASAEIALAVFLSLGRDCWCAA